MTQLVTPDFKIPPVSYMKVSMCKGISEFGEQMGIVFFSFSRISKFPLYGINRYPVVREFRNSVKQLVILDINLPRSPFCPTRSIMLHNLSKGKMNSGMIKEREYTQLHWLGYKSSPKSDLPAK